MARFGLQCQREEKMMTYFTFMFCCVVKVGNGSGVSSVRCANRKLSGKIQWNPHHCSDVVNSTVLYNILLPQTLYRGSITIRY